MSAVISQDYAQLYHFPRPSPCDRFVGGKDVYFPYLIDVLKLSHYHVLDRRFIVGTNQGDYERCILRGNDETS